MVDGFNNGLIIQFGTATRNETPVAIWRNFPISFTTSDIKLLPWYKTADYQSEVRTDIFGSGYYAWNTSSYVLITSPTLPTHYYIAIGY